MKLPATVTDHCVGYQSVVQAIENNAALVTAFDAKHSIGIGGESPYGFPTRAVGRHDDILIARSVADFAVDAAILTPVLVPRVSGAILATLAYARLGVGQWQIFLATAQLYGVIALMKSTASVDQKATCYRTASPSSGPSVIVSTWLDTAGVWAMEDLPFSLVVWTQVP